MVGPVVVMSHAPQTRLDAADDDGNLPEMFPNHIAVHDGGIVRPFSHDAAGGEGVGFPPSLGHRIVIYHGIHIAGRDEKSQPRFPQGKNRVLILHIRLGNHTHRVASGLQHAPDDRMSEGGMVHIGIPADVHEIQLTDSLTLHILPAYRQKSFHIFPPLIRS